MPVCSTCGTHYGSTVRICVRDGTPLVAGRADDPHLGKLLDGKYRIDSFISGGGMGAVYRAQHVMLGKTVAVKVIKNELVTSDEIVSRFQREARAASNLHHPNIVSVYDLGQTSDGTLYIAMEFIDGLSLRETIKRDGPMPAAKAIDILRQVAGALSAAHRKQIVHRDLKSHNLMLASEDGRTVAKLVDFGIAKTFDESTQLTAAGYMLGTPHYMSPEQAAGHAVDHRADLYSLGVILYEMMTGEVPFSDTSLPTVLVKLATETPAPPSARRPDLMLPAALDAVAMRCLEKNPADRFQSAEEFADALERASEEIHRQPSVPPIPAMAAASTLVRPRAPLPQTAAATAASSTLPAARPRAGFGLPERMNRRVAALVLAAAVVAIALATGIGLSSDPADEAAAPANTITQPPALASAPANVPAAPAAAPVSSTLIDGPNAPLDDRSTSEPPVRNSGPRAPSGDQLPGTAKTPQPDSRPQATRVPAAGPPPPNVAPGPLPQIAVPAPTPPPQAAPAATPQAAPSPQAAPQIPAPQAARNDPTVAVACRGFADVCSAIQAEMVRTLQREGLLSSGRTAPDVEITAIVTFVSERSSNDFGTPIITRTYSVELKGDSRGAAVAMPAPRMFGFDVLFGNARLQENARVIAAGAVEAVRTFWERSRP